jgi:hypothetical protein
MCTISVKRDNNTTECRRVRGRNKNSWALALKKGGQFLPNILQKNSKKCHIKIYADRLKYRKRKSIHICCKNRNKNVNY